jgi:hypothetical protein
VRRKDVSSYQRLPLENSIKISCTLLSALKIEAVCFFKTMVCTHKSIWNNSPEDQHKDGIVDRFSNIQNPDVAGIDNVTMVIM